MEAAGDARPEQQVVIGDRASVDFDFALPGSRRSGTAVTAQGVSFSSGWPRVVERLSTLKLSSPSWARQTTAPIPALRVQRLRPRSGTFEITHHDGVDTLVQTFRPADVVIEKFQRADLASAYQVSQLRRWKKA